MPWRKKDKGRRKEVTGLVPKASKEERLIEEGHSQKERKKKQGRRRGANKHEKDGGEHQKGQIHEKNADNHTIKMKIDKEEDRAAKRDRQSHHAKSQPHIERRRERERKVDSIDKVNLI